MGNVIVIQCRGSSGRLEKDVGAVAFVGDNRLVWEIICPYVDKQNSYKKEEGKVSICQGNCQEDSYSKEDHRCIFEKYNQRLKNP